MSKQKTYTVEYLFRGDGNKWKRMEVMASTKGFAERKVRAVLSEQGLDPYGVRVIAVEYPNGRYDVF